MSNAQLTPAQVETITAGVLTKAESSIVNRVAARNGTTADVHAVRKAVGAALTKRASTRATVGLAVR